MQTMQSNTLMEVRVSLKVARGGVRIAFKHDVNGRSFLKNECILVAWLNQLRGLLMMPSLQLNTL